MQNNKWLYKLKKNINNLIKNLNFTNENKEFGY